MSCSDVMPSSVVLSSSDQHVNSKHLALATSAQSDMNILHQVLGHPNHSTLAKVCSILHVLFSVKHLIFVKPAK